MSTPCRDLRGETAHLGSTNQDLLRRARRGEEAAYHEIVDGHGTRLYRLAYSLVGNAADAEDVLQETFAGAFRHLGKFGERSSIKTWLSRILVRQAARCHRHRARRTAGSLEHLAEPSGRPVGGGSAARPESEADTHMDIRAAMQALQPAHREVIALREFEGMTYEEIAEVLAVPRGTVESRLFRARQELRKQLSDYER